MYIGKCLLKIGKLSEATSELLRAYMAPCVSVDDKNTKDEVMKMLRGIGVDPNQGWAD